MVKFGCFRAPDWRFVLPRTLAFTLSATLLLGSVSLPALAAPGPAKKKPPLNVAIIWHQHQPKYPKEPGTNIYTMPWVRMHAAKDYVDMAAIAEKYPSLRMTFNLTPVLLEQVLDYAKGATDRAFIVAQKPAMALDAGDKDYIAAKFFDVTEVMLKRFPAYAALKAKPRRSYTTQDWRDLQVWFNLAWLDPDVLAQEPFKGMVRQGRGFTENDKARVLNQHVAMLKEIVPLHRRLQDKGQIEVSTTPYFHPILPLIHDSDSAKEAMPGASLPLSRFQQPDDARRHVQMATQHYQQLFGRAPRGMWPGEGSVGQAVAPIFKEERLTWIASDEEVLGNSVGTTLRKGESLARPDLLYRPYQIKDGPAIVFRDRRLSDDIGFRYSKMSGKAAAADLLAKLKRAYDAAPASEPRLVTLILDGENAWENYPDDGKEFFHALYKGLTTSSWVSTVTPSQVLAKQAPTPLPHLWAGSWIGADFATWIGEGEENRAWDLLEGTRAEYDRYRQRHGSSPKLEKIHRILMAAQGSDWFWWYGKDQNSGRDEEFDEAFRGLLKEAYDLMGMTPPPVLDVPIVQVATAVDQEPTALLTAPLDGKLGAAWDAAGRVNAVGGAMAEGQRIFEALRYGWDDTAVYLAFEYAKKPVPMELFVGLPARSDGKMTASIPFASQFRITVDPTSRQAVLYQGERKLRQLELAAGNRHVELKLPWSAVSAERGESVLLAASAVGTVFPARPLTLAAPPPQATALVSFADPEGDPLGAGALVPPANPIFTLPNFDLRGVDVGESGSDWVFTFRLGRIDNPWNSPSGLSLATLDLYLATEEKVGAPAPLLPGRRARAGSPWTHALWIEGWQSGLYRPDGQKITEIRTVVDPLGRRVVATVPKTLLPSHPRQWKYLAFTMVQDGFSLGRIRTLTSRPAYEHFSGNAAPILDLLSEGDEQASLLKPLADKTVLPLRRPPTPQP
jgi:alpha-amylase/alpha-mannosidase (GH57 family)